MAIAIPLVDTIAGIIKNGQDAGLKQEEIKAQVSLAIAQHDAETIASVNATMQAEAKSDHWLQWAWRPIVGLTFSLVIINNYVLLPYFTGVHPIAIPDPMWLAMLTVLGAASYTHGQQMVEREKAQGAVALAQVSNGNGNRGNGAGH
jgi:hypothetical protein